MFEGYLSLFKSRMVVRKLPAKGVFVTVGSIDRLSSFAVPGSWGARCEVIVARRVFKKSNKCPRATLREKSSSPERWGLERGRLSMVSVFFLSPNREVEEVEEKTSTTAGAHDSRKHGTGHPIRVVFSKYSTVGHHHYHHCISLLPHGVRTSLPLQFEARFCFDPTQSQHNNTFCVF